MFYIQSLLCKVTFSIFIILCRKLGIWHARSWRLWLLSHWSLESYRCMTTQVLWVHAVHLTGSLGTWSLLLILLSGLPLSITSLSSMGGPPAPALGPPSPVITSSQSWGASHPPVSWGSVMSTWSTSASVSIDGWGNVKVSNVYYVSLARGNWDFQSLLKLISMFALCLFKCSHFLIWPKKSILQRLLGLHFSYF